MALSRKELALLRISDGIASPSDRERLGTEYSSEELDFWMRLPTLLRDSLFDRQGQVDVAEAVIQEIHGVENTLGQSIRGALQDDAPVDLTAQIMTTLQLEDENTLNISELMLDPEPIDFSESTKSIMDQIMGVVDTSELGGIDVGLIDEDTQQSSTKLHEPQLHVVTQELSIVKNPLDSDSQSSEFLSVIEFTEDIEIEEHTTSTLQLLEEEEDSDEICFVDEIHVDEQTLLKQSEELSAHLQTIQQALQPQSPEKIDIWSDVRPKLIQPPLRFVRDDIEVVDKYPEVETEEDVSTQVEFLNSKRIDADSTISKVSITVLGSFMALAALWLVMVLPSMVTRTSGQISTPARLTVTFEVAEVNELEVEDLEVAENVNVQILQGEENAPTIIFIDDVEEI